MMTDTERIFILGKLKYLYGYMIRNSDAANYAYSDSPIRREIDWLLSEREKIRLSDHPVDIDIISLIVWTAQIFNHRASNETRYAIEGRWTNYVSTLKKLYEYFRIELEDWNWNFGPSQSSSPVAQSHGA